MTIINIFYSKHFVILKNNLIAETKWVIESTINAAKN